MKQNWDPAVPAGAALEKQIKDIEGMLALARSNRETRRKAKMRMPQERAIGLLQAQIDRLLDAAFPEAVPQTLEEVEAAFAAQMAARGAVTVPA